MLNNSQENANSVQIFNNPQFGDVRTIVIENNEPLFCLRDLCSILGLNQSAVRQRLSDDVVSNYIIPDKLGRNQSTNFVNEDGLYDVILDSRKPEAKIFRKWITSEVLPTIRKTGGYLVSNPDDTPEDLMARALIVAQKTMKRHEQRIKELAQANQEISLKAETLAVENEELIEENKSLAPLADYTREVLQSTSTFTANQIAKDLGMSAISLNKWLNQMGVQYKESGQWLLYYKYQNKGYVDTRVSGYTNRKTGEIETTQSTVWTERGRKFIIELYNKIANRNTQIMKGATV